MTIPTAIKNDFHFLLSLVDVWWSEGSFELPEQPANPDHRHYD